MSSYGSASSIHDAVFCRRWWLVNALVFVVVVSLAVDARADGTHTAFADRAFYAGLVLRTDRNTHSIRVSGGVKVGLRGR
jgi:hypothetical protein